MNKKKKIVVISIVGILALSLLGAGVYAFPGLGDFLGGLLGGGDEVEELASSTSIADDEIDLDAAENADLNEDHYWTYHDTPIVDDLDTGLVGTWVLESNTANGMPMPMKGRTLTIRHDGSFFEDYSTSELDDEDPAGISQTCDITGTNSGNMKVEVAIVLDGLDEGIEFDPTDPTQTEISLMVKPDPSVSNKPNVKCTGPGGGVASTTATTVPLGFGVTITEGVNVGYVEYNYTMDEAVTTLTITSIGTPAEVKWIFHKVN